MRRRYWIMCAGLATLATGFVAVFATAVLARPVVVPGYAEMTEKAALVVIATPVARKELPGATSVPGAARGTDDGGAEPIPAVEVETAFRVVAVLRGKLADDRRQQFTLLHLKETDPSDRPAANAVALVDFEPGSGDHYLMFLNARKDGRYEPYSGQTDPALSIERLRGK